MRAITLLACLACAVGLGACGGGGSGRTSVPASATAVPPPSLAGLPGAAQAQVRSASAAISAYCRQAAKSLDSGSAALASPASDASVRRAVGTLIALGRSHPKQMGDVLFAAERTLASGCYPSQGARLDSARASLGR